MKQARSAIGCLAAIALLVLAGLFVRDYARRYPQDVPWTALDLDDPVGRFTGRKLAGLGDKPGQCRALMRSAGVGDVATPPVSRGDDCGFDDGMRLTAAGRSVGYSPGALVTSCPVAAALYLLERRVIDDAALRHFDQPVRTVEHFGSYSCRRLYGREDGPFSEHATANAVDIAGFVLEDGTRIRVLADWDDPGAAGAFLRDVRDGACDLFATVLSPDYNEAHRDHLHLDQAGRGATGFRMCR